MQPPAHCVSPREGGSSRGAVTEGSPWSELPQEESQLTGQGTGIDLCLVGCPSPCLQVPGRAPPCPLMSPSAWLIFSAGLQTLVLFQVLHSENQSRTRHPQELSPAPPPTSLPLPRQRGFFRPVIPIHTGMDLLAARCPQSSRRVAGPVSYPPTMEVETCVSSCQLVRTGFHGHLLPPTAVLPGISLPGWLASPSWPSLWCPLSTTNTGICV